MKKFKLSNFSCVAIIIICLLLVSYSCFNTWKQIASNKFEKQRLEKEYNSLVKNEDVLEEEVIRLQDPEYAAKYAREKYLYTKDGELIIDLQENKN